MDEGGDFQQHIWELGVHVPSKVFPENRTNSARKVWVPISRRGGISPIDLKEFLKGDKYYPHYTYRKSEAQRGEVTCPKSPSRQSWA